MELPHLSGNHNEPNFANNESDLSFMGDNTRIHFEKNSGFIKIRGNNVRLRIDDNTGKVYFVGDCARIFLKSGSPQQSVVPAVFSALGNLAISAQELDCPQDGMQRTLVEEANCATECSTYVSTVTAAPCVENEARPYTKTTNNNDVPLSNPAQQTSNLTGSPPLYTPSAQITQNVDDISADPPPPYTPTQQITQNIDDISADPPTSYEPPQQTEKYLIACGSYNRIQLTHNLGEVEILGNSTRLVIHNNVGYVKYTGDSGKICLGGESTVQSVDYVGSYGTTTIANNTHAINDFLQDF